MTRRGWSAGGAALRTFGLAAMLVAATPSRADSVADWRPFTVEASQRFGLPVPWIERVMRAESGGRTMLGGRLIVSRAGAMGLMQLMPGTWAAMRAALGLGSDPFDPHDNILAGAAYLRLMYDRFGYPGMFAAYNAGPGRYAAWRAGRGSLPDETVGYLAAVSGDAAIGSRREKDARRPALFIPLNGTADALSADRTADAGERLTGPVAGEQPATAATRRDAAALFAISKRPDGGLP